MSLIDLSKYKFSDDVTRYNNLITEKEQPRSNTELISLIPGFIDRTFIVTTTIPSHLFSGKNIEYLAKVKRIVDEHYISM